MPRDSRERTPVYIYIYIHVLYTLSLHYTMYTVYQVEVEKSSGHSLYGHVEPCTKNVFICPKWSLAQQFLRRSLQGWLCLITPMGNISRQKTTPPSNSYRVSSFERVS